MTARRCGRRPTTAYADWLIAIFDRWFEERPKAMELQIFESLVGMILGRPGRIGTSAHSAARPS